MKYRLIVLDLDGTLLDNKLQIRYETIKALKRADAQGVQIMIATGRHHVAAYPYWSQLGLKLPAICCNGAYLYDYRARQPLSSDPMTRKEARELLKLVRKHGIYTMIYEKDFMAYESISKHLRIIIKWAKTLPEAMQPRICHVQTYEQFVESAEIIWKFTLACDDVSAMSAFVSEVERSLDLSCVWHGQDRLDICRRGNSKGSRLAEWIATKGILPEEVIAFGDEHNDMEMLLMAGMGIAMGNSDLKLQACADCVIGDNESNGIADALERFLLAPAIDFRY